MVVCTFGDKIDMLKVSNWHLSVCIAQVSDTDGYSSGSVWIKDKEEWSRIRKEIDEEFKKMRR